MRKFSHKKWPKNFRPGLRKFGQISFASSKFACSYTYVLNTEVTWLNTRSTTALDTRMQRQDKVYVATSRALEAEGFSTWGVGVAENFNDSDSGQTFCSPIVTVCATNVRKRHTWQFKQLDASTRDDHGYSDRRQRTNLHTFTQGQFQISSVPWAHHATYTLWMQPFGACHWNFHLLILAGTVVAPWRWLRNNEREFSWELVHCYVMNVTEQW